MANSSTAGTALGAQIPGFMKKSGAVRVTPYRIVIDTIDTDLIIASPDAGHHALLLGLSYCEADAHNLTIKSGSTTEVTLQFAANTPVVIPVTKHPIIVTDAGEDLIFSSSVAIGTMLAYVAEADTFSLL